MNDAPIIVTGASRGIGFAVAQGLVSQGSSVVLTARDTSSLDYAFGGMSLVHLQPWDLAETESLDAYINTITEQYGLVGGFVHCAGHNKVIPLHMNKVEDYEALWRIHALAPMRIVSLLTKKGKSQPGASFVLISSLSAHEGSLGNAAYAAAKGALEGFLKPAAVELAERQIRINIVVPGMVRTNMSQNFLKRLSVDQLAQVEGSYPLGLGQPEQVAEMILFLLSDKSSWITGQKFFLDGGHMSRK